MKSAAYAVLALLAFSSLAGAGAEAGARCAPLGIGCEQFLLDARMIHSAPVGSGVTESRKVTLSDGSLTHPAQIQIVNKRLPDLYTPDNRPARLYDSYRYNIAAFQLSRILGLPMVPACVERLVEGQPAAVSWWVDDVLMLERDRRRDGIRPPSQEQWNRRMSEAAVFDNLIFNTDRHAGNYLITRQWKLMLIDHTRAFVAKPLLPDRARLSQISRERLEALRRLDAHDLGPLQPYLQPKERQALLQRARLLVKYFDAQIQKRGSAEVVFDAVE